MRNGLPEGETPQSGWKIDKTVNLPFLLSCMTAICGGIVWGTQINSRIQNVEASAARVELAVAKLSDNATRIDRMDERTAALQRDIQRIQERAP